MYFARGNQIPLPNVRRHLGHCRHRVNNAHALELHVNDDFIDLKLSTQVIFLTSKKFRKVQKNSRFFLSIIGTRARHTTSTMPLTRRQRTRGRHCADRVVVNTKFTLHHQHHHQLSSSSSNNNNKPFTQQYLIITIKPRLI